MLRWAKNISEYFKQVGILIPWDVFVIYRHMTWSLFNYKIVNLVLNSFDIEFETKLNYFKTITFP